MSEEFQPQVLQSITVVLLALVLRSEPSDAVAYSVGIVLSLFMFLAWNHGRLLATLFQSMVQITHHIARVAHSIAQIIAELRSW